MRVIIQRVSQASVSVDNIVKGKIEQGMVVMVGIGEEDTQDDVALMVDKIINLRIFSDENGKMNLSLQDVSGSMLVISQFTLFADTSRGRRPFFGNAADPALAKSLYEYFLFRVQEKGIAVEQGVFGAMMTVSLVNDGPVTIWLDSEETT